MFVRKIFKYLITFVKNTRAYLIFFCLIFLTNCGQYTSMIGPSYTLFESGNVLRATSSYGSSHLFSNAKQSYKDETNPQRICQELHSSELRSIFFETQDNKGCIYDPMSIYR